MQNGLKVAVHFKRLAFFLTNELGKDVLVACPDLLLWQMKQRNDLVSSSFYRIERNCPVGNGMGRGNGHATHRFPPPLSDYGAIQHLRNERNIPHINIEN
jgi:hypothetical protein